jgi:hypothetical protein
MWDRLQWHTLDIKFRQNPSNGSRIETFGRPNRPIVIAIHIRISNSLSPCPKNVQYLCSNETRYSLASKVTGVWFPTGVRIFSLRHNVQTDIGLHLASSPMRTGDSFLSDIAAGAWSWPLTSMQYLSLRIYGAMPPSPLQALIAWCLDIMTILVSTLTCFDLSSSMLYERECLKACGETLVYSALI